MSDSETARPEDAIPATVEPVDDTATGTGPAAEAPPPQRWSRRWRRVVRLRIRARRRTARHLTDARTTRVSAALSGLLAAVLASAGWFVFIGPPGDGDAAALVSDYLEALRDGDTAEALEIAGVTSRPVKDDFLTDAAIRTDWRVDSLIAVGGGTSTSTSTVHVRISDDSGRRTRGAFIVSDSPTAPPRIDNPFAHVGVNGQNAPTFLDLNGTVAPLTAGSGTTRAAGIPVFPGSYRLYAKSRPLFAADPGRALLLPVGVADIKSTVPSQYLGFSFTVTDEAQKAVQRAVTAMIDKCVESDELAPGDCPFSAADDLRSSVLETREQFFSKVEDLAWKVKEQPKVRLFADPDHGTLSLSQTNGTTITLTGNGIPVFGDDGKRVEFTVDCPYELESVAISLTGSGGLTLTPPAPERRSSSCHLR